MSSLINSLSWSADFHKITGYNSTITVKYQIYLPGEAKYMKDTWNAEEVHTVNEAQNWSGDTDHLKHTLLRMILQIDSQLIISLTIR